MDAITLWEPWATLIALGAKEYETRSWKPPAGLTWVAIHAAQDVPSSVRLDVCVPEFVEAILPHNDLAYLFTKAGPRMFLGSFKLGHVIAVARVVDVVPTATVQISERERVFGDYTPGRWAWKLADVRRLFEPVKTKGGQRIWKTSPAVHAGILEQTGLRLDEMQPRWLDGLET